MPDTLSAADLLCPEDLDKVANAVRRAHYGYGPHSGVPFAELSDGEKDRYRVEARQIVDACIQMQWVGATGDDRARVKRLVAHFIAANFGVALDLC